MKIFMAAMLSMSLLGCTATAPRSADSPRLANGVWSGTLATVVTNADDSREDRKSELLIASCNGMVRLWADDNDGKYRHLGTKYVVQSNPDSHLIYFMDADPAQPGWVEIHSHSMLELSADKAVLLWSRAVNNRDGGKTPKNRYFFSQGITELRRTSHSCDDRLMQ